MGLEASTVFLHLHTMKMKFKRFSKSAAAPTRGTYRSARHDLYAAETVLSPSQSSGVIKTDIGFCIRKVILLKCMLNPASQHSLLAWGVV